MKKCLSGYTQIDLGNGRVVSAGSDYAGTTTSDFKMNQDGTIEANGFSWDLSTEPMQDTNTGSSFSFGDFLGSLGSNVGTFLGIVNKTAETYEKTTGSKLINTTQSQAQANGSLSESDMNTLSLIINSAINKMKTYGIYVGIAITGIIVASIIMKKKRAK